MKDPLHRYPYLTMLVLAFPQTHLFSLQLDITKTITEAYYKMQYGFIFHQHLI